MSDPFESEFNPKLGEPAAREALASGDVIAGGRRREPRVPPGRSLVAWATVGVLAAGAVAGGSYLVGHAGTPSSPTAAALPAAATGDATPAPTPTPGPGRDHDGRPFGPGGFAGAGPMSGGAGPGAAGLGGPLMDKLGALGGKVLHAEATVQTPNGTEVVDTQVGTVSGVDTNANTLTVKSSDNVSFTYVVDSNTRIVVFPAAPSTSTPQMTPQTKPQVQTSAALSDVLSGDTVRVVAVRTGDTRTAKGVVDGEPTFAGGRFGHPGGRGPWGGNAVKPTPTPTGATA